MTPATSTHPITAFDVHRVRPQVPVAYLHLHGATRRVGDGDVDEIQAVHVGAGGMLRDELEAARQ